MKQDAILKEDEKFCIFFFFSFFPGVTLANYYYYYFSQSTERIKKPGDLVPLLFSGSWHHLGVAKLTHFAYNVPLQQHDNWKLLRALYFLKLYECPVKRNSLLCAVLIPPPPFFPPSTWFCYQDKKKSRAVTGWFERSEWTASWQLCVMQKKKKWKWRVNFDFLLLLLLSGWSYTNRHPEIVWFIFCLLV